MYRMQMHSPRTTGMHWQIGKGGGFHYAVAEARGESAAGDVFLGGPPALILAAIAPLPENVPELLLASLSPAASASTAGPARAAPLVADAELALVGRVRPGVRRPRVPSATTTATTRCATTTRSSRSTARRRRDAIFPATVVGKPRQEDFFLGDLLQELLSPLFPLVMPGVVDLWSYGETGYHSLAGAVVRERYAREAMASAFRILGEGQLSLTKFLLVTDRPVDLRDFRATLEHVLARTRPETDLYVFANLSMDTLDYTGPEVNEGVRRASGSASATRCASCRASSGRPCRRRRGARRARLLRRLPGRRRPPADDPRRRSAPRGAPRVRGLAAAGAHRRAAPRAASAMNFLWTTFTRFEPAADVHAARTRVVRNHLARTPPIADRRAPEARLPARSSSARPRDRARILPRRRRRDRAAGRWSTSLAGRQPRRDGRLAGALAADARLSRGPAAAETQELLRDALAAWSEEGIAGLALLDAAGETALLLRTRERAAAVDTLLATPLALPSRLARVEGLPWTALRVELPQGGGALALVGEATPIARALAPDELGEQARLLLVERSGALLWGQGGGVESLPAPLREAALSGHLSGAGRFRVESEREIVAAWSAADGGRWIVLSLQPGEIAEAVARRMTRRAALAVAGSLLLVGAISAAAWSGLVRPLRALLAAQRSDSAGAPDAASETAALRIALADLERRSRDRSALDQIFLGRYQVIAHLGSGGMGSVYRGWDPRLQRTVALKTIPLAAEGTTDEGASKLLAEAIAAAQIVHPNVVAVYDAEEARNAAFVAMELVEGIGLDRYLEKRGRLDWRETVPLASAIAHGLAAAHARGLVHRDIKPGNVLLGHDGAIKIADFGLATFLHRLHDVPGKVFGTPGFLAPEALRGMPIDERCDLFAVGVVLFRTLTGRYPIRGTTFQQLVLATIGTPAPRPEEIEHAPREVSELVCALLEKDPDRRLAPASEVAARFDAILHEHRLVWRLDYAAGEATGSTALPSASTSMPTVRLDADLA
jgi:hypothetical protein